MTNSDKSKNELNSNSLNNEIIKLLSDVLDFIGEKGFLVLLGVRNTNKSTVDLPPKREKLVNEFNKPFSSKSRITVGARAVTKHADRNTRRDCFWGSVSGNEESRNINSNLICLDIIANAAWISIFEMNSNTRIVEIRNGEGFGIRWEYSDYFCCSLKGLVEPQWIRSKNTQSSKNSCSDSDE